MKERRALVRHRTFFKGRIYFNNRLSSMECTVRDVTANGARLDFSESVTLPDAFELYIPNRDEYFHARVIWRRGGNLGISWTPDAASKEQTEHGTDNAMAARLAKLERDFAVLQRRLDALQTG